VVVENKLMMMSTHLRILNPKRAEFFACTTCCFVLRLLSFPHHHIKTVELLKKRGIGPLYQASQETALQPTNRVFNAMSRNIGK
jgi:hypothetical protein